MSLLGIDIGSTGSKVAAFSDNGEILALEYEEFDHIHPRPGWAEIDSVEVLQKIKHSIAQVVNLVGDDKVAALSVTSMGEAVVPVTADRKILGNSILNYCSRGVMYSGQVEANITPEELYTISGCTTSPYFSMHKLMWVRDHQPEIYNETDYFLPWISFISFMLGADPAVDFSLANRTLLFDINEENWSQRLLDLSGLDRNKMPPTAQAGTIIGYVSHQIAKEVGLSSGIPIVLGAHDQCANSVGCGSINDGQAMFGMGTFPCATPVFSRKYDPAVVIPLGVNTEHHAVKNKFVSFIFNQGGSVVKWYRDTFAKNEHLDAKASSGDVYPMLFDEMPEGISPLIMLPYFSIAGLPALSTHTSGVIAGLRLESKRGDILKGIVESIIFDLKITIEALEKNKLHIDEFITVGGGSKSDKWMQICADIFEKPMARPDVTECGAMGSAIIAGVSCGIYGGYQDAVEKMVKPKDRFVPDPSRADVYQERFEKFVELRSITADYLEELSKYKF